MLLERKGPASSFGLRTGPSEALGVVVSGTCSSTSCFRPSLPRRFAACAVCILLVHHRQKLPTDPPPSAPHRDRLPTRLSSGFRRCTAIVTSPVGEGSLTFLRLDNVQRQPLSPCIVSIVLSCLTVFGRAQRACLALPLLGRCTPPHTERHAWARRRRTAMAQRPSS